MATRQQAAKDPQQQELDTTSDIAATMAAMKAQMTQMAERLAEFEGQNDALLRAGRDQDNHAASRMHEEHGSEFWEEPGLLDHPALREPRPGMVQMWVTTHIRGEFAGANVFREFNKGWRPRLASTLPEELRGTMQVDFRDQQVIGVHGMVLCERSSELHERQMRQIQRASRDQMRSVEERLGRAHNRGDSGMGRPRFTERKTNAERGVPMDLDE